MIQYCMLVAAYFIFWLTLPSILLEVILISLIVFFSQFIFISFRFFEFYSILLIVVWLCVGFISEDFAKMFDYIQLFL